MKQYKTSILVLAIFMAIAMCLPGLIRAGVLEPPGAPAPTMKTLDEVEPRIPIDSLPHTISSSGSYYITSDLTTTGNGIIVNAENVTIDLMGYSIEGPGSASVYSGIKINACKENVEIKNGTIKDFQYGIYAQPCAIDSGYRIINIRVSDVGADGINVATKHSLVKNCTVVRAGGYGFYLGNYAIVIGNAARLNGQHGITALLGSVVIENTASDNTLSGLSISGPALVKHNYAGSNGEYGIRLNCCNSLVDWNVASNNTIGNILSCTGCILGTNSP